MKAKTQNLFSHARRAQAERDAPLAARLRPRTLDEFVGQEHIVGPGRLLRRAIQADQLSSLIFCGPPGTGKTTLAMVIANTTHSQFITLNAVLAGVADIRAVTDKAQEQYNLHGERTILFIDEVHRWNKAQQDALLPWVENGTVVMIGATTENPWFSVNRALLSRSRVFQLVPLTADHLRTIAAHALADEERGYGKLTVDLQSAALDHLVNVANGDARSLLNALELAVQTTPPQPDGTIVVDLAVAEQSIQQRAVLYDPEGDYHFDTISAFIKSVRGSDPDAALYWLAKMVYAGEDPRYIFRRLLILASEDIGLADPYALGVVEAAAAAFERVGLPEGRFHLAHATLYLATTDKSNSALAFFDALDLVEKERDGEVPNHLRDASRDKEGFGHGEGYLYPHAFRDHWVAQQYLPEMLQGKLFYQPSDQGYEARIRERVARRREEQIAAMVEPDTVTRYLTFSPASQARDRWLQRTVADAGVALGALRERVYGAVTVQRHDIVLDLNAGSGLLTWEGLRRVPEGGVWALVRERQTAEALRQQAARLPEIERPTVLCGELDDLPRLLADGGDGELRFDLIVGRNALTQHPDKRSALGALARWLRPGGTLSLAEVLPRQTQRLYELAESAHVDPALLRAWAEAEEAIYAQPDDAMVNWDAAVLRAGCEAAGLTVLSLETVRQPRDLLVTQEQVARWFGAGSPNRPSYAEHLRRSLSAEQVDAVRGLLEGQLVGQVVAWHSSVAYLVAKEPGDAAL